MYSQRISFSSIIRFHFRLLQGKPMGAVSVFKVWNYQYQPSEIFQLLFEIFNCFQLLSEMLSSPVSSSNELLCAISLRLCWVYNLTSSGVDLTSVDAVVMRYSLAPWNGVKIGFTLSCWSTGELLNSLDHGEGVLDLLHPCWICKDDEPLVQAS